MGWYLYLVGAVFLVLAVVLGAARPRNSLRSGDIERRTFNLATLAAPAILLADSANAAAPRRATMYGLISQLMTKPEHRDELVQILATATKGMPGCLSYVIALDASRSDAVWVTEVWTDSESHDASIKLPEIQAAMAKGRPLITGIGSRTATRPMAGV